MYAYGGTVLRVDLTEGTFERVATEEHRAYLGGRGLNVKRLWDWWRPRPLLACSLWAGPGGRFPGSPVQHQRPDRDLGDGSGGFVAEMRFAGYDQIILRGRAPHPVYLYLRDDVVELRDARHLWGTDVWEATAAITQELGDPDVQVATIGQGAENGVSFGGIFVNLNRPVARCGMGTVMASKNLKAVAVRGRGSSLWPTCPFREIIQLGQRLSHPEYEIRTRLARPNSSGPE